MSLKEFFKECHEKGIVKMLSIYILSSWIILQVISVIQEPLGLPLKTMTYLIIVLLIGFPIYIYYIWRVRFSSRDSMDHKLSKKDSFHKIYFTGLGLTTILSFLIAFLISINNFGSEVKPPVLEPSDKIAVLEFGNNTGENEMDILGRMAADWIIHGITKNQVAEVISPEIVTSYASMINNTSAKGDRKFIREYFKPGKIITGNFYKEGEQLYLQCRLLDGRTDEVIIAFKNQTCNSSEPLKCIEDLKQVILSYLATSENPDISLEEDPPKFEAYQFLLNAKTLYNDSEKYLELLNKAIEADPDYFEPKVLKIAYFYNLGEYRTADSLRKVIDETVYNDKRQLNLLSLYENLLEGNNRKIFNCMMYEYNFAPFELGSNSSAMVIALQFVNRPELVEDIYLSLEKDISELDNCLECKSRVYIKSLADNVLEQYEEVFELMEPVVQDSDEEYLHKPLISAYIRSGKDQKLNDLFSRKELSMKTENLNFLFFYTGKEYLRNRNLEAAKTYFNKVIKNPESNANTRLLADTYYYLEEHQKALDLYLLIKADKPEDIELTGRVSVLYSKLGLKKKAQESLKELDALRKKYQYGSVDYQLATFYASKDNWEESNKFLLRSIAAGNTYTSENFQNDPHFVNYLDKPGFEKVLTYWH